MTAVSVVLSCQPKYNAVCMMQSGRSHRRLMCPQNRSCHFQHRYVLTLALNSTTTASVVLSSWIMVPASLHSPPFFAAEECRRRSSSPTASLKSVSSYCKAQENMGAGPRARLTTWDLYPAVLHPPTCGGLRKGARL